MMRIRNMVELVMRTFMLILVSNSLHHERPFKMMKFRANVCVKERERERERER